MVENQPFQKFIFLIQLQYKLPSHYLVKNIIIQKFLKAQEQINDYLQLSKSKISLIMDM